jgi:general secretion pathway protein K
MLALWALFLLSAMITTWALDIDGRITLSGNANRMLEAVAMACSGSEIALHPAVKPGSAALQGGVGRQQSYSARITGEGGRLNLNWLLGGENPRRLELLRRFLENKGIDLNERDHMIDCLLDWVDPDNLFRMNGAEASESYKPANRLFTRLDDLRKVKGWGDFTSTPGWEDYFTVNSTGPIDLIWASRDILVALPGMTPEIADRFLKLRSGEDGIDGTADDPPFKSIEEIRMALGFNPEQFKQFTGLTSFRDPVLRVVSTGKSGNVTRVVQIVFRKTGASPQVITWKEL